MQHVLTQPAATRTLFDRLAAISPVAAAAATFLAVTLATGIALVQATGGAFVYPLDDPYIHLALAERLAAGHYGLNAGEITSPSSSVLWPFLLVPGAGTSGHVYWPLAINLTCGLALAVLFGRFASRFPLPPSTAHAHTLRLAMAVLLVLGSNIAGLAFTGMEHVLQVLMAAAIALGLIEVFEGRGLPWWAAACAVLGPSVRYEMLALTLAVALTLAYLKNWKGAAALLAASLVLPAALSAYLIAHGNPPLPNSVIAKLGYTKAGETPLARMARQINFDNLTSKLLMWAMVGVLITAARRLSGAARAVAAAAALAALLHFVLGRFGWFYRYEVYAFVFCGLIALWSAARMWRAADNSWLVPGIGGALGLAALAFAPALALTPPSARNIHEQQAQMARFVQSYGKPFAVNDIGLVSFKLNPAVYMLDLYGLASTEAARQQPKTAAWLDDVTQRHATGLAVINDYFFGDIPASWTLVGRMALSSPAIMVSSDVAFYATATGNADDIRAALERFKPDLPPGVRLDIESGKAQVR